MKVEHFGQKNKSKETKYEKSLGEYELDIRKSHISSFSMGDSLTEGYHALWMMMMMMMMKKLRVFQCTIRKDIHQRPRFRYNYQVRKFHQRKF